MEPYLRDSIMLGLWLAYFFGNLWDYPGSIFFFVSAKLNQSVSSHHAVLQMARRTNVPGARNWKHAHPRFPDVGAERSFVGPCC